jgi:hypothetical protein
MSTRPVLAAIAAAAVAVTVGQLTGCANDSPEPSAQDAAGTALRDAADDADRLSTASGYPFATSLANQLRVTNPEQEYEAMASPAQVPARTAIGVYTTASTVWLSKRVPGGLVVELRRVRRGPARGTYGPALITPSGLAAGDFVTPIDETWTIVNGPIARIARDPNVSANSPASLRVDGTGKPGRVPSVVYQVAESLGSRAAGTVLTVNLVARAHRLSRHLAVETKLEYRDGSYEFFLAAPQRREGGAGGIPKGSYDTWLPLESRAVASKPLVRATVYAVDTGVTPLRGSAWIDDLTLAVSKH